MQSSWTHTGPEGARLYSRPLGLNELGFYYDSHINKTATTLMHNVITILPNKTHPLVVTKASIERAWCASKAQFPLLAATVRQTHASRYDFVVAEERLKSVIPDEVSVFPVSSSEEAEAAAMEGERKLSDNLLCRILVLSRTDDPLKHHVFINISHLITDGVANITVISTFLDNLSSLDSDIGREFDASLELAVAAETLVPHMKMSIARQRWRRAAGQIVCQIQDKKRTGGQTLPRSFGPVATRLPAQSGFLDVVLSQTESLNITRNLKAHKISVGNALPVLSQVALARLLCRRYVRGEIDSEEWAFRQREPYHTAGPINLRPFLDKSWFESGGHSSVSVNIGYFYFTLGYIPLPSTLAPGDSAPEFCNLMSPERFLLRCRTMKRLASRYLKHPLFFEVGAARLAGKIAMQKQVAARWEKDPESFVKPGEIEENNVSLLEQAQRGTVMAHGWSTFGAMGAALPREYPSSKGGKTPTIRLESFGTRLHCRTGELYLGAGGSSEQLRIILHWDKNVFQEHVVQEWVSEVVRAMQYYLGTTQTVAKM
ncbi:hypothetical protein R3P38DRAFT_2970116 [Favolaschia claudopus]|uniref:Acyltransferase n=1 Tax=Favolaschia claudopus TaxID=2862362 RepID=A0AAW0B795_9AGAR